MKIVGGLVIALLLLAGTAAATAWSGVFDMSATAPAGLLERTLGQTLVARSVARRATAERDPVAQSPEALRAGLAHYREDCLGCHGAPGLPRTDLSRGLNPPPPDLSLPDAQSMSDGQLYQVTAYGIRMTGMPAWVSARSEKELWELVAFVRHLPQLTPEERQALARTPMAQAPAEAAPAPKAP